MKVRAALEDQAWYRLTSHFFVGLFDFGVLSEAGSDAFRRLLLGVAGAMLAFGMMLTRAYVSKYAALSARRLTLEEYRLAIFGDDAMTIGLPMLVIAFAAVLVSQSLFPDETDFRGLLVLPVSRRTVFVSKLLALTCFSSLFIIATQVAMLPLAVVMAIGRWSGQSVLRSVATHLLVSVSGSIFVLLAVAAVSGVLLMCVPRARLPLVSTIVRSLLLGALVLSIPLVGRLTAIRPLVASESPALYFAPPVWFVAIERMILGTANNYLTTLAQVAIAAFVASLVLVLASYLFLYSRFDRVLLRPADASGGRLRTLNRSWNSGRSGRQAFEAIHDFMRATLVRSSLHQGVFVALAACAAALIGNSVIGLVAMSRTRSIEGAMLATGVWAPFALMFVMMLAVRAALVLPVEPRANWVFRVTEIDPSRAEQLNAVAESFARLGVVWPLAALFPAEWALLGPRAIVCTLVALPAGLIFAELQMVSWRRIPFTCSYMPGKRFIGHTLLLGLLAFVLFTTFGYMAVSLSFRGTVPWVLVMIVLTSSVMLLRRHRARVAPQVDLIYEDSLPNEIEPLRLSPN